MPRRGTPQPDEQFGETRYPPENPRTLQQIVPQVAAEAARAALQAAQERETFGVADRQQPHPSPVHGAQADFTGETGGQAGRLQPESFQEATQSELAKQHQQFQERTQGRDRSLPAVDVIETPDEVRVFADLPGVNSESIQIEAVDDTITLSAERIDGGTQSEEGRSVIRERGAVMERSLQIPQPVDLDGAEATWDQGVVTITLPKEEPENRREIGIQ